MEPFPWPLLITLITVAVALKKEHLVGLPEIGKHTTGLFLHQQENLVKILVERDAPLHAGLAVLFPKENRVCVEIDIVPFKSGKLGQPDTGVIQGRDAPEQEDGHRVAQIRLEVPAESLDIFSGTCLAPDNDAPALPDQEDGIFGQVFLPDAMVEDGANMPVVGIERSGRATGHDRIAPGDDTFRGDAGNSVDAGIPDEYPEYPEIPRDSGRLHLVLAAVFRADFNEVSFVVYRIILD